ncbi:MAG TPA: oligosaccharide flippase family protein, partial [Acidimicrobiales bacterium]|nr:oligosaccharide flippase family protein [Acidimicrobiales bacterium]
MAEHPIDDAIGLRGRPLSLLGNVRWSVGGSGIHAVVQFVMLLALARFGSAAEVGRYAWALALTAPVQLLSNLGLRGLLASDVARSHSLGAYFVLNGLTSALALLVSASLALVLVSRSVAAVVLAVACSKAVESLCEVSYGVFQRSSRMDLIAWSLGWRALLGGGGFVLAAWLWGDAFVSTAALGTGW